MCSDRTSGDHLRLAELFTLNAPRHRSCLSASPSTSHCILPLILELPAIAGFRQRWSTLRADSQLKQSVTHTPTDAGPLNSAALASHAIALMRELSPEYLRQFLAYVDGLVWLEQSGSTGLTVSMGSAVSKNRVRRRPQT